MAQSHEAATPNFGSEGSIELPKPEEIDEAARLREAGYFVLTGELPKKTRSRICEDLRRQGKSPIILHGSS